MWSTVRRQSCNGNNLSVKNFTRHSLKVWHKAGWKRILAYQETLLCTPVGLDFVDKSTERYRQLPWLDESQENDHRSFPTFSPNRSGLSLMGPDRGYRYRGVAKRSRPDRVPVRPDWRVSHRVCTDCSWWALIEDVLGGVAAGALLKYVFP